MQGVLALKNMDDMREVAEEIETNAIPSLDSLAAVNLSAMRLRVFTFRLLVAQDEQDRSNALAKIGEVRQALAASEQQYERLISIPGERQE